MPAVYIAMIDFARNFNAFGPPPGTFDIIRQGAERITAYSHRDEAPIRQAYADFLNVEPENIAQGIGATAILYGLPDLFPGKEALVFAPSFWEYREANHRAGRPRHTMQLHESASFHYDLQEISDLIRHKPMTVYICNPNNPTSQLCQKDELTRLAEDFPASDFVIDETYLPFRDDFRNQTLTQVAAQRDNIHVVLSLSKVFTVPGIRSGALVSDPTHIAAFRQNQLPHATNALTEVLVPWLLQQEEFLQQSQESYTKTRTIWHHRIHEELDGRLLAIPPQANFILAKDLHEQGESIAAYLKTEDLEVRKGAQLDSSLRHWFRFCLKTDAENEVLLHALKRYYARSFGDTP